MQQEVKEVRALLEGKIHEVFLELQMAHGITSGDIEPLMALKLDELTDALAEHIAKVIEWEKSL